MPLCTELHLAARASRSLLDHSLQHNHGTPCMHLLALHIFVTPPYPRPASLDALYLLAECENGQIPGMCALASVYSDGLPGALPPSPARAVFLWRKAVSAYGCALSSFLLAQAVEMGRGVRRYPALAAVLYEGSLLAEGFGFAAASLARMLEDGAEGVLPDIPRAVRLYEFAVRKGSTDAIVRLARILKDGRGGVVPKGMVGAVELLEEAARDGNSAQAMNALASMLEKGGQGVGYHPERAMALYEHAAQEKDVHAMICLARMLLDGHVERDVVRAVSTLESAMDLGSYGSHLAVLRLAELLANEDEVRDEHRAMDLLNEIVEDDDYAVQAKMEIAWLLSGHATEITMDAVRAAELYEDVVRESGHVNALIMLAELLVEGRGDLEADPLRAIALYERAVSEYDDRQAMNSLGCLYSYGVGRGGVGRDVARAIDLFERAAECGCVDAKYNLARLLTVGSTNGNQAVDLKRGMRLFEEMALNYDHLWSMINLARCLVPCEEDHVEEETGRRNIARAVALLERAIRIGVEHSEAELLAIGIRPLTRKEYEGQARLKVEDAHDGEEDEEEEDDEDEYDEGERMTERLRESGITSGAHVVAMVMLAEILVMSSEPRESEKATRLLERAVSEVAVPNALEKVTVNFEMLRVLAEEGRDDAERCARVGRLCRLMMERSGRCEGAWVLGEMMRHGRGARQSARDAVHWFERGVSGGEARAAVALAEMLVEGEGDVPAERGRAMLLAAQAVAGGGLVEKRAVVVLARAWNARRGKG